MSTLASNINSATTVLSEDFYAQWRKGVSDAGKVRFARIAGILIGGLGVLIAIALAVLAAWWLIRKKAWWLALLRKIL